MNVSAPTSSTVPTRSRTKSGVSVGSVPAERRHDASCAASEPATASTGTMTQYRPMSMHRPMRDGVERRRRIQAGEGRAVVVGAEENA